jgi:hypothetical protein
LKVSKLKKHNNPDIDRAPSAFDITGLVDDLRPVRSLKVSRGLIWPGALTGVMLLLIGTQMGWRPDLLSGAPSEMFLLRAGTLALLGGACAHAVVAMASPSVGKHSDRWQMALAAAALFPLAAIIAMLGGNFGNAIAEARYGLECLMMSLIGGLATAAPMIYWLRKGAPTSPERAGWLTGVASGAMGAFAYNFHCPFSDLAYTGMWYTLAIAICALIGRIAIPHLIRW